MMMMIIRRVAESILTVRNKKTSMRRFCPAIAERLNYAFGLERIASTER